MLWLLPATRASQAFAHWRGGTGDFENLFNWDLDSLSGTSLVIDGNTTSPSVVTINSSPNIRDLFISAGDSLIISSGNDLTLFATNTDSGEHLGAVQNDGTLALSGSGSEGNTDLAFKNGTFTLSGTGKLTLSNNANNRILGNSSTDELINASTHTIQGSGQLGVDTLKITNAGTILANQSKSLVVDPGDNGLTNTGTLRATNGATLTLQDGTITNTGGLIQADNNSFVDLTEVTITGGTLTSIGSGHFHSLGNKNVLSGLAISTGTNIEIDTGNLLKLSGAIQNAGTLKLLNGSDLEIASATVTLSGSGTISLDDDADNRIRGSSASNVLDLGSNTVTGAGKLGDGSLALTTNANSKIVASGANPLIIDVTGTSFTNNGTLRASGTGGLHLSDTTFTNGKAIEINSGSHLTLTATNGAFTQSGSGSSTALNSGTLTASTLNFQSGGVLTGIGTINGAVINGGTIAPGVTGAANGVGILAFNNSLTLTETSILKFDLGGTGATAYDKLVAPTVTLNGSLVLTFVNNFQNTVTSSDTFTLITTTNAEGRNGIFNSLPNGSILGTTDGMGFFTVNYTANALTISNFTPVPEPSIYALFGTGLLALAAFRRWRR